LPSVGIEHDNLKCRQVLSIGQNKITFLYWKIGVHWLAALRDLLALPFDEKAWHIEGAVNRKGVFTLGSEIRITLTLNYPPL
jgi:hypothetical protein